MENRNQFFQILDQVLIKVQFYQLPLHKITQILKLLQMAQVSDPGQIKYNTFIGISKLYQKFKDKLALHIYQEKFSYISKQMKDLLFVVFQNISQILFYKQNASMNMNSYYNMPYMYSGMMNMQAQMMPDPYYMNIPKNNITSKQQNSQNQVLSAQDYKKYYEQQSKNYYFSLMQQNNQMMPNPYTSSMLNINQNMNSCQPTNSNSMTSNKIPPLNPNNGLNQLNATGPTNYQNSSTPQNYGSYMDYMKAYQSYIQQSYNYSTNNQEKIVNNTNLNYKGLPSYQNSPENNINQMSKKNLAYQQKQYNQKFQDRNNLLYEKKFANEAQNQKIRQGVGQKPNPPTSYTQNLKKQVPIPPTRPTHISNKNADPQIQIVHKILSSQKGQKRLIEPNKIFQFCACKGYYVYQQVFCCCNCKKNFHNKCLNQSVRKSQESKAKIQCSLCKINGIDPLNKVDKILGQYFLVNLTQQKFQATVNFKQFQYYFYPVKNSRYQIQMRCIRAGDHLDHLEITWPDQCIIKINGQKIIDIPALQSNSSLKKRKDYSITLTQNIYGKHINQNSNILQKVRISLQTKVLTQEQLHQKKIKNEFTFVLGIYLIEKLNVDQLFNKITNQVQLKPKEDYFKYLMFTNQNSQENQVQIQQISINLFDPFSWELINTPTRGSRCHHGSCFDLKTFISFMSTAKNRTWKCPICGKDVRRFELDVQQQQILRKAQQLNPIPKQACVFKDSTIAFKIENQSEDQTQKQKKISNQLGKTKKIAKQKREDSR